MAIFSVRVEFVLVTFSLMTILLRRSRGVALPEVRHSFDVALKVESSRMKTP
jgi:hypothetical protein